MSGFEEVAPGVMVNKSKGWEFEFPHPDPLWVIRNATDTASVGSQEALFVFSTEELAKKFIEKKRITGTLVKRFTWDECVERFGGRYSEVLIDHRGEPGFYNNVPLRKGI